jgi:hypothetical protein
MVSEDWLDICFVFKAKSCGAVASSANPYWGCRREKSNQGAAAAAFDPHPRQQHTAGQAQGLPAYYDRSHKPKQAYLYELLCRAVSQQQGGSSSKARRLLQVLSPATTWSSTVSLFRHGCHQRLRCCGLFHNLVANHRDACANTAGVAGNGSSSKQTGDCSHRCSCPSALTQQHASTKHAKAQQPGACKAQHPSVRTLLKSWASCYKLDPGL